VIVLQLLYTYTAPLQSVVRDRGAAAWRLAVAIARGLIFLLVVEAEKAIIRAMRSRQPRGRGLPTPRRPCEERKRRSNPGERSAPYGPWIASSR